MSKSKWLSDEQVQALNEQHGWFKHRDAQSDVSRAFANDAVEAHERLRAAAPELLEACQTFAEWLRRESGVGDLEAPWRGKRDTPEGEAAWREWYYENLRLCDLAQEQARAAIAKATAP